MTEVYNLRIGDMVYNKLEGANIIALIYKTTPKYIYYAVCARNKGQSDGNHYITRGHKVPKEKIYKAIKTGHVEISYGSGIKRRRKIEVAE